METTVKTALFPYAGLFRRLADRLDVWHKKIPFHLPESLKKNICHPFLNRQRAARPGLRSDVLCLYRGQRRSK